MHNNHIQWKNFWWTHIGFNLTEYAAAYSDRAARGGPAIRLSSSRSMWAGIQSDSRRTVTGSVWFNGGKDDEGRSFRADVSPRVDFRISSRFSTSMGVSYSRNGDDSQFYSASGAVGNDTTHYTFARLDQTTMSFNARLNFTATPNLSFQFYGEPFVSNGTYADQKEINNARAERYADRFKSYRGKAGVFDGFNYRQFNSNARGALRVPAGQHAVHGVAAGAEQLLHAGRPGLQPELQLQPRLRLVAAGSPEQHVPGEAVVLAQPVGGDWSDGEWPFRARLEQQRGTAPTSSESLRGHATLQMARQAAYGIPAPLPYSRTSP